MRCRYCGYRIPEGKLYCENCGREVRIVPDYNPLDDMLTAEIKGEINVEADGYGRRQYASGNRNRRPMSDSERRRRKRELARKKARRRERRRNFLLLALSLLLIIAGVGVFAYMTSYIGAINKGNKALSRNDYTTAKESFNKALSKDNKRPEAYTGLSKVYQAQDNTDKAEQMFEQALKKQPQNVELYRACIEFYMRADLKDNIPTLLDEADSSVSGELSEYIVKKPTFSLNDSETYDDVQQLTLTAESGYKIYYTKNKKKPTTRSHKYKEPIQIEEGDTTIYAIAVNKQGVPSLPVKKSYTVELPIEDAPAVSPSTGQYNSAQEIVIKVPDGYEAYYTTDKSDPTTDSTKYTGPIEMPAGETLFKAVLVNAKGRVSGVTTRNYVLNSD